MKRELREQKAITLVALIITIIVLLILAVVAVGAVQENGIIQKAQYISQKHEEAKLEEEIKLALLESALDGKSVSSTAEDTIIKLYKAAYEFTGDSEISKTFALSYLNTDSNKNTFVDCGFYPYKVASGEETITIYQLNYSPDGGTYVMDKDFTLYKLVQDSSSVSGYTLYSADNKKYSIDTIDNTVGLLNNDKYIYLESFDGSYTAIYYYKGSDEVVDVAKDFEGKCVTHIEGYGFASLEEDADGNPTTQGTSDTTVKEIILPDTIVEMCENTFFYREGLEKVKLSKNITVIPAGSFRYCRALKSIEIPEKVTRIGTIAFRTCSSLVSINIPNKVTSIGENAFLNSGLTTININKAQDSISGAPWGASSSVTINWLGE